MTTYTIGTISEDGELLVKLPAKLPPGKHRVVVVIESDATAPDKPELPTISVGRWPVAETALLSEVALSDWNHSEEDEAWQHLQKEA